jgi:hypothetical protein
VCDSHHNSPLTALDDAFSIANATLAIPSSLPPTTAKEDEHSNHPTRGRIGLFVYCNTGLFSTTPNNKNVTTDTTMRALSLARWLQKWRELFARHAPRRRSCPTSVVRLSRSERLSLSSGSNGRLVCHFGRRSSSREPDERNNKSSAATRSSSSCLHSSLISQRMSRTRRGR